MSKLTKDLGKNLKALFSPLRTAAATACLLSMAAPSAFGVGFTQGSTFMLFLECNNDGVFHVTGDSPLVNGWEYTKDGTGDNTDGDSYDIGGIAMTQIGDEVYVAITGGTPLAGAGFDRNIDKIFHGDLLFAPPGVTFQEAMENGQLSGIHFSGSEDSGADGGLGVYKNVSAKGVGAKNFGHSSQENLANITKADTGNVFIDKEQEKKFFDDTKGYNVIAEGTKVQDDGFALLDAPTLENLGLDLAQFGDSPTTETFGFKFNIDALFPPRTPVGIGTLIGRGEKAGISSVPNWQPEIDVFQENISNHQEEATTQETIENTEDQEATRQENIRLRAEAERQNALDARNVQGGINWNQFASTMPGMSGYEAANSLFNELKREKNNVQKAQDKINENTANIATAKQERDAAQGVLDQFPTEEAYLSDKKNNADQETNDAYTAVTQLTAKKAIWDATKPGNWDELSPEEQWAAQEAFNSGGGEWVAIRQDGSPAKDELELQAFTQKINEFETKVGNEYQNYQDTVDDRDSDILRYQNTIATQTGKLNEANKKIAVLGGIEDENQEENQETKSGKERLLTALNSLLNQAQEGLNNIDPSATLAQQEERKKFYDREIAELKYQIKYVNDSDDYDEILTYLGDRRGSNPDGYYRSRVLPATYVDDRQILDENGNPILYTAEHFEVEVATFDNEANRIYDDENQLVTETIVLGREQEYVDENGVTQTRYLQKEQYINDDGVRKARYVDLIGKPMTVGTEYTRGGSIWGTYNNIRKDGNTLANISTAAATARDNALAAKEAAETAKNEALAKKNAETEAMNNRLLAIEDEIVTEETKILMAQRMEETRKAEAEEKALEEKYGVRTEEIVIPETEEGVAILNQQQARAQKQKRQQEQQILSSVSVPEPSLLMGLITFIGGGIATFGRGKKRQ